MPDEIEALVSVSRVDLHTYDANALSFRAHAQPINAEKVKLTLGVAPMDIDEIRKHQNQDNIVCPMMEFTTIQLDIFPLETANSLSTGLVSFPTF